MLQDHSKQIVIQEPNLSNKVFRDCNKLLSNCQQKDQKKEKVFNKNTKRVTNNTTLENREKPLLDKKSVKLPKNN